MSKLRIAFWGPLGYYKGWSALKALEKWALLTHNPVAWQWPKQTRLTQLFERFKPTVPRGTRFGLLVMRERAKLGFHKSMYRMALDMRGFPGRRKRKMPGLTLGDIQTPQPGHGHTPIPTYGVDSVSAATHAFYTQAQVDLMADIFNPPANEQH